MSLLKTIIAVGRRSLPFGKLEIIETDTATINRLPTTTKMIAVSAGGTVKTYALVTVPANSVIEELVFPFSAAFDGTVKVGVVGSLESIVADEDIPKSLNLTPDVIKVGMFVAVETAVIVTLGIGTTGAGHVGIKITRYA